MSDDETRAADALAALQALNTERMEYKADPVSATLSIENRDVATLFSVDNLDQVGDITEVSAFKRSIDRRSGKIPHLFMHDLTAPAIANVLHFEAVKRSELPRDVQQSYPDATGGMVCHSRYLKVGKGAEIFEGIKEGIEYQASYGFKTIDAERKTLKDGRKARVIKELLLYEVSTTLPGHAANDATRTLGLKTLFDYLTEYKAGWRHGQHADLSTLNEIIALAVSLGGIYTPLVEPDPQFTALTSEVDDLLAHLDTMSEVST
jgi:hypothetical protein